MPTTTSLNVTFRIDTTAFTASFAEVQASLDGLVLAWHNVGEVVRTTVYPKAAEPEAHSAPLYSAFGTGELL